MPHLVLRVNGKSQTVDVDDDTPLLCALRDDLNLCGPKFGCGLGPFGTCMVLVDGVATRSCMTTAKDVAAQQIVTLEGLGTPERMDRVQAAFLAEQAAQYGYCANGMIIATYALLRRQPKPTEAMVRAELAANLCRCGTHDRVVRAVQRAAGAA